MRHTQVVEKNIEYLPVIYLTKSMKSLFQKGKNLAAKDCSSILITGERGTGKELLAKSIHYSLSPNTPFITINCVNVPFVHFEEKVESCFTLLSENRDACLNARSGNKPTLFLRDIEKLEDSIQTDLFSLIQEKLYQPTAQTVKDPESIRLMFSQRKNGPKVSGSDRSDNRVVKLFHPRTLSVLPLRERREDINPLAQFFIDKFSKEYDKDIGGMHSEALALFESYEWMGNVGELRDVIENAVLLAEDPLITRDDIRFNISKKSIALESFLRREDFFTLDEIENIYIQTVLRRVKNNKAKAARILGISRNTLQRRSGCFSNSTPQKKKNGKKNGQQPALF